MHITMEAIGSGSPTCMMLELVHLNCDKSGQVRGAALGDAERVGAGAVHGAGAGCSIRMICWICRSRPSSVCHLGPRFSEGLGPSGSDAKRVELVDYKPKQARWLDVTARWLT